MHTSINPSQSPGPLELLDVSDETPLAHVERTETHEPLSPGSIREETTNPGNRRDVVEPDLSLAVQSGPDPPPADQASSALLPAGQLPGFSRNDSPNPGCTRNAVGPNLPLAGQSIS